MLVLLNGLWRVNGGHYEKGNMRFQSPLHSRMQRWNIGIHTVSKLFFLLSNVSMTLSSPHFNKLLRGLIILNQSESGVTVEILLYSELVNKRKPLFVVLVDFGGANILTMIKFIFPRF